MRKKKIMTFYFVSSLTLPFRKSPLCFNNIISSEGLHYRCLCLCSFVLYCLMPVMSELASLDWLRIKCVSAVIMP